jgi:hypothetical protein
MEQLSAITFRCIRFVHTLYRNPTGKPKVFIVARHRLVDMVEYTAVEQEQRLLDDKDSVELYDVTGLQSHRPKGLRAWLKSPPAWIAYLFIAYTIVSVPVLVWISLNLHKLQQTPYCKFSNAISAFYSRLMICQRLRTQSSIITSKKYTPTWAPYSRTNHPRNTIKRGKISFHVSAASRFRGTHTYYLSYAHVCDKT